MWKHCKPFIQLAPDSGPAGRWSDHDDWSLVIRPRSPWWKLDVAELWHYRDLLRVFIRCECLVVFKRRNVFGPLWFFLQPLLTSMLYTVVFAQFAKMPTDHLPPMLFYLAGTTPWNYFASCLTRTAGTFTNNAGLFGKVYFPRLASPLSLTVANLIQFASQFALFFAFLAWYDWQGQPLQPHWFLMPVLTPLLLVMMAGLGLGIGIVVSALTTKYRDLGFLVGFGLQLAMFATPVIYPASMVPAKYHLLFTLNPMTAIIQSFRNLFIGGVIPWTPLGYSAAVTLMVLLGGIILFNRAARNSMDTV
jgi:lipopolysaccharide transport system permease protein